MNAATEQSIEPLDSAFLEESECIDWKHPRIIETAVHLAKGADCEEKIAKRCFVFVRDQIRHSIDFQLNPVTCTASDVLLHGTGFCYAKSHLLAALLRANGIPAGLCSQRLPVGEEGPPYCLHGLNAIHLGYWYLVDARGNKPGVDAKFSPPARHLAFPEGKFLPGIFAKPLPVVVEALTRHNTFEEVLAHLPDIDLENIQEIRRFS